MTNIDLKVNSIITTVGPSGCGKSYFSNELVKQVQEKYSNLKVSHISSDEIRMMLLDDPNHYRFDQQMLSVSKHAFEYLEFKLNLLTSWPINHEIIIVDTTGLNDDFRQSINQIARKNQYNSYLAVFDYKSKSDYIKNLPEDESNRKTITLTHVKRLRERVLKNLNSKFYTDIIRIKKPNDTYNFQVEEYDEYTNCFLPTNKNYSVVGDIHGSYNELVQAFDNIKKHEHGIVLVGDYIDKNNSENYKKIIDFLYDEKFNNNVDLNIVIGNHERFVYNYLKGNKSYKQTDTKVIEEYFVSINFFNDYTEYKEKFFKLYENSKPFYIQPGIFIATHAPCKTTDLQKLDIKYRDKLIDVKRNQINFKYILKAEEGTEDYKEELEEKLSFVKEQADTSYPYHIWGHIALQDVVTVGNEIGIDTGCVYGNKLTYVNIDYRTKKRFFKSVEIDNEQTRILPTLFKNNFKKEFLSNLDDKSQKRLNSIIGNKINFISGTVSPSSTYEDKLESIDSALEYYKSKGVDKVIVQRKHMGSRGNLYLDFENFENSFLVSRNGYKVNFLNEKDYEWNLKYQWDRFKSFYPNARKVIVDCEIMPWSALGKGLIDTHFKGYEFSYQKEFEYLKKYNFESVVNNVKNNELYRNWLSGDKEVKSHFKRTFKGFNNIYEFKSEEVEKRLNIFKQQLINFGQDVGEEGIWFEPFMVLKVINKDGSEETCKSFDNVETYAKICNRGQSWIVVDLKTNKTSLYHKNILDEVNMKAGNLSQLYSFVETQEMDGYEGVMVKPKMVYNPKVAPMLKVRNKSYLTIVYGPDYLDDKKYKKLLSSKNVDRKTNISIKEFEIGLKMLSVNENKITDDNVEYKEMISEMISLESSEKMLDPRL